jgi:hypothetical protein
MQTEVRGLETRLSNGSDRRFESLVSELRILKESIAKLTPPQIIGGFKASESILTFVPGSSPLNEGIISHLTKVCGCNPCDRQCLIAFADSANSSHSAVNAAALSTDAYFESLNSENQSIGYDFKDNQAISPTHYAIRSVPGWGVNSYHPKSWVIEVSNDRSNGNSWVEIDRRMNNQDLNGPGIVQTFSISRRPSDEFRFIRLRQIGVNHHGGHYLCLAAFEIFGQLRIRTAIPR